MFAQTPEPPYYACIFTSIRSAEDPEGYEAMTKAMLSLAQEQKGFLGVESVRGAEGMGITVSYWASLEDIRRWRENERHRMAKKQGKENWYQLYKTRICKVEQDSGFGNG